MNINVRSAFLLSKAFVPDMKKNNEGSLLFVNSIAGLQSFSNSAAYLTGPGLDSTNKA